MSTSDIVFFVIMAVFAFGLAAGVASGDPMVEMHMRIPMKDRGRKGLPK